MTKNNNEDKIKKIINEVMEFAGKYNLRNIDYIIVSEENYNSPYNKESNEKPCIRWGGNMYLPMIKNEDAERLPIVIEEVREKIKQLGFVLEDFNKEEKRLPTKCKVSV